MHDSTQKNEKISTKEKFENYGFFCTILYVWPICTLPQRTWFFLFSWLDAHIGRHKLNRHFDDQQAFDVQQVILYMYCPWWSLAIIIGPTLLNGLLWQNFKPQRTESIWTLACYYTEHILSCNRQKAIQFNLKTLTPKCVFCAHKKHTTGPPK